MYQCLIKYASRHEDAWESGGIAPEFVTSALMRGEWLASRPGCFTRGERAPDSYYIGCWVGLQSQRYGEEKHPFPLPGVEPRRPAHSTSVYLLSYPGSPFCVILYHKYTLWAKRETIQC
jgi:hypothetical protein